MRKVLVRLVIIAIVLGLSTAVFFYATMASEPTAPGLAVLPTPMPTAEQEFLTQIAQQVEPLVTKTIPATFTPIPTLTHTPAPDSTATPRTSPSPSPTSSITPMPTFTPTSVPQGAPGLAAPVPMTDTLTGQLVTPVPTLEIPSGTTNILLLGTDSDPDGTTSATHRTDSIIIVSVNTTNQTASMVSIPRDLYVSIPGWQSSRINTAVSRGEAANYPGGGIRLLRDTILYNFGIPIHYYARVNFEGFQDIVDAVGGVEVPVSCQLRDWRLKEPGLDVFDEDNWEMFTLSPGIYDMDGDTALWYVRSRRTTSDFDRGRRQQQVLRGLLNKGVDVNLIGQIPTLWGAYQDTIETDMDMGRILQLASVATAVRANGIQHLYLTGGELQPYVIPETGAQVQLLDQEKARETFARLYTTTALNSGSRGGITVEIRNGTGDPMLAELAADNLAWHGFIPQIGPDIPPADHLPYTTLTYKGENFKGSYEWLISWIFNRARSTIELNPEAEFSTDYQVILGTNYDPCRNPLYAPRPSSTSE